MTSWIHQVLLEIVYTTAAPAVNQFFFSAHPLLQRPTTLQLNLCLDVNNNNNNIINDNVNDNDNGSDEKLAGRSKVFAHKYVKPLYVVQML